MSLEKAAQLIRERANQQRAERVQRAVIGNAVGDLAATAAIAKSRIDQAKSGGKHWKAAVKLAQVIIELDGLQRQIAAAPPARRGEFMKTERAITELMTETWVALRANVDMDAFGGFSGNAVKLARAVLAADAHAKPKSTRVDFNDRSWVTDAFAQSMKRAEKSKPKAKGKSKPKDQKKLSTRTDAAIKRVTTKGAGAPKIVATASSTAVDLEGDAFSLSALKQMAAYYPGRLAFSNHSYNLPDDLFGQIETATIVKRGDRHDLDVVIAVEKNNPRAMQTLEYIRDGATLGVSVGVMVDDSERQKDGTMLITEIRPLELSIVGIPANQTAWTHNASE